MRIKLYYFAPLVLIALDRIFKYIILKAATYGFFLIPQMLKLELHKNFGILANLPLPQKIILPASFIIIAVLIFFIIKSKNNKLKLALLFIVAGAISNLLDRIIYGFVIDYFLIFNISYFNLADLMITLGILLFIV